MISGLVLKYLNGECFVICGFYKYTLLASTEFNLTVPPFGLNLFANDLIRVVTLHATVMTSGSLSYLMGCGLASYDSYQVRYL